MLLVTLTVLIGTITAASVPQPKAKQLNAGGGIQVSVDHVPGLKLKHLKYVIDDQIHFGSFYQAVDGQWYHKKEGVDYKTNKKVHYSMLGEMNGKPVFKDGTIDPEQFEVAIMPPQRIRRAGHTVLRDDFSGGNIGSNWNYEVSMYGGYNWEIQVYTNDPLNCFMRNGHLFLKPTLTSEKFGEGYLHSGTMDVAQQWGSCTNADRYGCVRHGHDGLLPPVMSCKLKSKQTVKFGKTCVRARIPRGDWIWPGELWLAPSNERDMPCAIYQFVAMSKRVYLEHLTSVLAAIWMLPRDSHYGGWPRSGEIDIMESRGNTVARARDGNDHGVNEIGSTLHWGPDAGQNKYYLTHGERDDSSFSTSFHDYCVDWTVDHIVITVDNHEVMRTNIGAGGFWQKGGFGGNNLWASGTKAAPFDQPFYLILNVAIAGTNGFFPDDWTYNSRKPWNNNSPTEPADFWNHRGDWQSSWQGDNVAMEVDWVEMVQY